MSSQELKNNRKVRESHFPVWIFVITLIILLVMAAIHTILVSRIRQYDLSMPFSIVIIMVYWIAVAVGISLLIRNQLRKSYEKPLKELAEAANAVAHGDFSIYVSPLHTAEKLDYLDVMIIDFNKMVEELGSIETLKTDFFSNVSHEIKTPLAKILNYAETLKQSGLSAAEQEEYLDTIIQSSRRLARLITNILKLNKLEKQNIQPVEAPYDLCRQLCECILEFEDMWGQKDIALKVDIEESAMIKADESLLELVWNNLLSNALKFTAQGGAVCLSQKSLGDEVVVKVNDNGCGMAKETTKHIFDKFYQGDKSHAMEGNGLGLALSRRVVELAEGEITVNSEIGVGTTFTVRLPLGDL